MSPTAALAHAPSPTTTTTTTTTRPEPREAVPAPAAPAHAPRLETSQALDYAIDLVLQRIQPPLQCPQ